MVTVFLFQYHLNKTSKQFGDNIDFQSKMVSGRELSKARYSEAMQMMILGINKNLTFANLNIDHQFAGYLNAI